MADIKITYESLFDLLRRERNREELQKLEETFYEDVVAYLAEKQSLLTMVAKDDYGMSADAEKTRIQFHNIKRILKELYDRREKKIVMLALNAVRTDAAHMDKSAFLPQEQQLYNDITTSCRMHRRSILDSVLRQTMPPLPVQSPAHQEKTPEPAPQKTSLPEKETVPEQPPKEEPVPKKPSKDGTKITFVKAVPRFSGGEDQVFGPFNPGDTATLPEHIASILLKKGRAEQA